MPTLSFSLHFLTSGPFGENSGLLTTSIKLFFFRLCWQVVYCKYIIILVKNVVETVYVVLLFKKYNKIVKHGGSSGTAI